MIIYSHDGETATNNIVYEYSGDTTMTTLYNQDNELINTYKSFFNKELNKVEGYDEENQLIGYSIYHFNTDPCGYSEVDYFDANDSLTGRTSYEYFDSNCSENGTTFNSENNIRWRIQRVRDDKNNAYQSTLYPWQNPNHGNIIQELLAHGNSQLLKLSYNAAIEYNSDNYPVSKTLIDRDGIEFNYKYEYY